MGIVRLNRWQTLPWIVFEIIEHVYLVIAVGHSKTRIMMTSKKTLLLNNPGRSVRVALGSFSLMNTHKRETFHFNETFILKFVDSNTQSSDAIDVFPTNHPLDLGINTMIITTGRISSRSQMNRSGFSGRLEIVSVFFCVNTAISVERKRLLHRKIICVCRVVNWQYTNCEMIPRNG